MGVFTWLKNKVRTAILDGAQEAIDALNAAPAHDGVLLLGHTAEPAAEPETNGATNGRRAAKAGTR